jgi:hypothetical protein
VFAVQEDAQDGLSRTGVVYHLRQTDKGIQRELSRVMKEGNKNQGFAR